MFRTAAAVAIGLCVCLGGAAHAADLVLAPGITLHTPDGWSAERDTDTTWLLERRNGAVVDATMSIAVEPRESHADALRQLAAIAGDSDAPGNYTTLNGWPALERKVQEPYEIPEDVSDAERDPRPLPESDDGEILQWRTTTAVAAAEQLVILETGLHPAADSRIADEALAIGRSLALPTGDDVAATADVQQLRSGALDLPELSTTGFGKAASKSTTTTTTTTTTITPKRVAGVGEDEAAISSTGQQIVVTGSCTPSYSINGGTSFATGVLRYSRKQPNSASDPRYDGDCSVTWGASHAFFISRLGGSGQHIIPVYSSRDNGQTFFRESKIQRNKNVDQPHIVAERHSAGAVGENNDRLYVVWRDSGMFLSRISCSKDSGLTWRKAVAARSNPGAFARVALGADGMVYVISPSRNSIVLDKFSGCSADTPLSRQSNFPVRLKIRHVQCPVPGLDRCNDGNTLSSAMVAPDDLNPLRVYIGVATRNGAGENIAVAMSSNGGKSFSQAVAANYDMTAVRFLPWIGVTNGIVYTSWYDRRDATTTAPDITSYYRNSLSVVNGALQAGTEVMLSTRDDPQCASGFPCGVRSIGDARSCNATNAFRCVTSTGMRTSTACDPRTGIGTKCPSGQKCKPAGGCPKFGDYDGLAAGGGKLVNVWASGTTLAGVTNVGSPAVYVVVTPLTTTP